LVLSEENRGSLLELLIVIRACFPRESAIQYRPIAIAPAAVRSRLKDLELVKGSTVLSWYLHDNNESDQAKRKTKKRKSMGGTQGP
jgi:hypothetical protein